MEIKEFLESKKAYLKKKIQIFVEKDYNTNKLMIQLEFLNSLLESYDYMVDSQKSLNGVEDKDKDVYSEGKDVLSNNDIKIDVELEDTDLPY